MRLCCCKCCGSIVPHLRSQEGGTIMLFVLIEQRHIMSQLIMWLETAIARHENNVKLLNSLQFTIAQKSVFLH